MEISSQSSGRLQRPLWLSEYIPELDGLRGIAVASVVIYHCHAKLDGTFLLSIAQWGWAGVNLFFVLSGFLITGIILDSPAEAPFFKNFYARRALRLWPVYALLLLLHYFIVPIVFGNWAWGWQEAKHAPWFVYLLFLQNIATVTIPGTIGPTWSLAIEEQYYVVWAPLARAFKTRALLVFLIAAAVGSPLLRYLNIAGFTKTHTLLHLDGIAIGSLIAVIVRAWPASRAIWRGAGRAIIAVGVPGAFYFLYRGSAFSDSFLALLFGGMLLCAITSSGERSLYPLVLKFRGLAFLGKISYGLYMTHILTFSVIGAFDRAMEPHGIRGNLAVVAVRLVLSVAVAAALWHGFEKPVLGLKRYFKIGSRPAEPLKLPALAATD